MLVDDRLRTPLLAQDWAAWGQAWRALDAEVVSVFADGAAQEGAVSLTLCGERGWQRYDALPRSRWHWFFDRFRTVEPHTVLEAL